MLTVWKFPINLAGPTKCPRGSCGPRHACLRPLYSTKIIVLHKNDQNISVNVLKWYENDNNLLIFRLFAQANYFTDPNLFKKFKNILSCTKWSFVFENFIIVLWHNPLNFLSKFELWATVFISAFLPDIIGGLFWHWGRQEHKQSGKSICRMQANKSTVLCKMTSER